LRTLHTDAEEGDEKKHSNSKRNVFIKKISRNMIDCTESNERSMLLPSVMSDSVNMSRYLVHAK